METKQNTMYLTEAELAERWRTSTVRLKNWRWAKKGPVYLKHGGGKGSSPVLYALDDIVAYEQEHKIMPVADGSDE